MRGILLIVFNTIKIAMKKKEHHMDNFYTTNYISGIYDNYECWWWKRYKNWCK